MSLLQTVSTNQPMFFIKFLSKLEELSLLFWHQNFDHSSSADECLHFSMILEIYFLKKTKLISDPSKKRFRILKEKLQEVYY